MSQLSAAEAAAPSLPAIASIRQRVADAAFGKPLITNVLRGAVAEAIVAEALEPEWIWCAADYASWDFERADGKRLEVKQSAERQSWTVAAASRQVGSFDIAARTGRYEPEGWVEEHGRAAHIYVLAHHHVTDASADHRDPAQWTFYVLPAAQLPDWKRIGIANVRRLAEGCAFEELAARVADVEERLA